ncbi:MAG: GNAT family N-acetyltransferase [Rhodobacteraceae bacterium]|nr:GNAT family N-acetyltransferase [Paracoccaceae bacterium]
MMLDWAAKEGWNPGLDDADAFYAADPEGFFIAEVRDIPVAAISVVNHSETYAFLGLYLCLPEFRGQGIGFGLWNHALNHAGDRTVGLDGVPAQEANYAKSGFNLASRTRRWTGHLNIENIGFTLAGPNDFTELERLDRAATGIYRDRFVKNWVENGPTRKTIVVKDGSKITGFATARLCREGCKIGPIVAANAGDALRLACEAAAAIEETYVTIDIPDDAAPFADALKQNGFSQNFSTARMFRGKAPVAGKGLQAVASLELG